MYRVAIVEDDAEQAKALTHMLENSPRRAELSLTRLSNALELESYMGGGFPISSSWISHSGLTAATASRP